ncbi:hypothetical protein B0H17DRAFT_854599, partial [Mycena rosella]
HEPNNEVIFPSREANRFYDFGMPDNQEWHVEEIMSHQWKSGRSVEFHIKWTAGNYTWELRTHLEECTSLDQYLEAMGVAKWQELP